MMQTRRWPLRCSALVIFTAATRYNRILFSVPNVNFNFNFKYKSGLLLQFDLLRPYHPSPAFRFCP